MNKEEFLTLNDSTHDNQSGVYENYNGRSDWLSKMIKEYGKDGYELYKRLLGDGITIFRKIKEKLDKQKVEKVIDKLISESHDMHSFVDDKKVKEVELFGDDKRELRERGYMRWAFEEGCSEGLIKLKTEMKLE